MRLIPRIYISRMHWFFEDYGCLRCGRKNVEYGANCLCQPCRLYTRRLLVTCMKRRLRKLKSVNICGPESPETAYVSRAKLAEKLLADLVADGL